MRLTWLAAVLVVCFSPAFNTFGHAQSASTWNKRGQDAEVREDYDTAYEDYSKAHQKKPSDLRYTARMDRMRFQAAASHVDRGRVLRQNGDAAGALNQFSRALEIDPGNEAAAQEVRITQEQEKSTIAPALPPPGTAASTALEKDIATIAGPVQLKPISDEPITLNMTEDAKNVYMAVGKIAGLNVMFDPDYNSRRISFVVDNVSLGDALRILGASSGTFYKVLTPDTILVAQNTKHKDLDDLEVQTFYLTNPTATADANEIYTALRQMLPPDVKSYLVPSQNAIIVRGTQDELTLTEKLLNDLDRTKPEVVVDVAILEVNRDKIRNLGITLPQSIGIAPQASNYNVNNNNNNLLNNGTTQTNNTSGLTLNTLANMNGTNFAITLTGATVNALLSDTDTRVLQNPSIRATDGQEAVLKIGSKIPIATGSYSMGTTSITGLGVQTQFTYMDVGVTIDITPTIHLNREVSLKLDVENSTQTGSITIEGVTEPEIGTRSDKGVIQLRDGEPCLLAGILDKEETNTNSGTPGLSDIPILKYFFGSIYKENKQDEVVFILIPHIVRESVLTSLNTRAIDTGTNTDIQLRRSSAPIGQLFTETPPPTPPSTTSAAQAASAMVQQLRQQAMPPTPPTALPQVAKPAGAGAQGATPNANVPSSPASAKASPGASPTPSSPISMLVVPPASNQAVGTTFRTSIVATNAHDLYSVPIELQFDPKVLQLVNVDAGGLLGGDGQPVALVHRDEGNGTVTISASRPPGVNGVNGQGQICILTFKAVGAGDSKITLAKVGAKNSLLANLPAVGSAATVHVK